MAHAYRSIEVQSFKRRYHHVGDMCSKPLPLETIKFFRNFSRTKFIEICCQCIAIYCKLMHIMRRDFRLRVIAVLFDLSIQAVKLLNGVRGHTCTTRDQDCERNKEI